MQRELVAITDFLKITGGLDYPDTCPTAWDSTPLRILFGPVLGIPIIRFVRLKTKFSSDTYLYLPLYKYIFFFIIVPK